MLPAASVRHYRDRQRLQVATRAAVRRAWRTMGNDFDASWPRVRTEAVAALSGAQAAAARAGAAYVEDVLAEIGQQVEPDGRVRAETFSGVASDGRPLDTLLYAGVTNAKDAVAAGATPQEALERGGRFLDMATLTQVADAARGATSVGIAARPRVGWVRMVNPPCCSRCAVLAGRWYRWSSGFQRHPRCDCTHIPSTEGTASDFTTDPRQLLERGLVNDLTTVESKALAEGADLGRVVNARRGSVGMTTTEATTRRGVGRRVRLTPEGIYRHAADRDDAVRLLRLHGYVI